MSDRTLVIGAPVDELAERLATTISSLPFDTVTKLNSRLIEELSLFLPPALKTSSSLFGLNLEIKTKVSLAHSGWLYSRYYDFCRAAGLDPATQIAFYSNGQFRKFEQFSVREPHALFLGFNDDGARALAVVSEAEAQYDPSEFGLDGYKET
jgi:hypothetical protein